MGEKFKVVSFLCGARNLRSSLHPVSSRKEHERKDEKFRAITVIAKPGRITDITTGMNLRLFPAFFAAALIFAGCPFAVLQGADVALAFSPDQIEFFEKEIRPMISDSCFECHSGTEAKAGLELDHRPGWLEGSEFRKVIDLKSPEKSFLLKAVRHLVEQKMPKEGSKLSEEAVANLVKWIALGLPWPEEEHLSRGKDQRDHWSFHPVESPAVPEDYSGNPIDYFVGKLQSKAGVKRAPRADRYTLYRRVYFDLLGLPPKYDELQRFVNDTRPDVEVWPALIDHLLASPHYGERWARHWMDVARYSDTKGYEAGGRERRFVYSYTYRDWLIRAFNEDMAYDQFVLYQLGADQLVDWNKPEKKHLAAMGFISLSKNGRQEIVIDDRLDTTFRGLMALTVSCARCHDHKFDPVSTQEYYGLYSVFANSAEAVQPEIGEQGKGPEYEAYLKDLAKEQKKVSDFLDPKLAELAKKFPNIANRRIQLKAKMDRADRRKLQNLQRVVDKFVADKQMEPAKALVVKDRDKPSGQTIFIRGNPSRRGDAAPRKFLSIASKDGEAVEFKNGSGRLEMAKQIVSSDNPLTARVLVNRVWMWHFGEGIVRTVSDFGNQGQEPDNPELLDYLSDWFVKNGWSIKKLHHLILTSETWKQQSVNKDSEKFMLIDAENRLLWKGRRHRVDLEQMRDGMLDVAKNLSNEMYGKTAKILQPPYSNRRSVYAFIDRQNLPPVFRNFDFSNPQETTGQRPNTTIPMQALFTLNSEFVQQRGRELAANCKNEKDRVAALHRSVFARDPTTQDRQLAERFLSSYDSEIKSEGPRQTITQWSYGYGSVDNASGKVSFTAFPFWTGERWQVKKEWPLKNNPLSYLRADRSGFLHPGYTEKESVIYRWESPDDMNVDIVSVLERSNVGKGDGVRAKVVLTGQGIVKEIELKADKAKIPVRCSALKVRKGDFVYFILEPNGNSSFDSSVWKPEIKNVERHWEHWSFIESFSGPADMATSWESYSQALLNSNRFLFID